jgi:16S rRNA (guanine(966)-N(2))-methyltransferase RsmD
VDLSSHLLLLQENIVRVIAGAAKGRSLAAVPGDSTRPITDRVKAALFSILNSAGMIEGRRYLDLFGGTGAVGIEALSRGAAEVVFCERDRGALRTLQHNLTITGFAERARIIPGDAFGYLARPDTTAFDVIYIAPPQYQELWLRALRAADARPELLLAEGQVIVQVFPKEWNEPELTHLRVLDRRQYGSTALFFFGARRD